MEHVIRGGYRHQHPGGPADAEGDDEPQGPVHRCRKPDPAAIHGEQPVEDLHPGGDGDQHGGNTEKEVDVGARAHGEEMMHPDGKGENGDGDSGIDQGSIAEQRFPGESGGHLRKDSEGRQDNDINLGVAPGPEEVGIHHHVAAQAVSEKMHPQVAVQGDQGEIHRQHWKGPNHEDVGTQRRPDKQRHLHELHTGSARFQDSDQKIDTGEGGADPRYLEGPDPIIHPGAGTERLFGP